MFRFTFSFGSPATNPFTARAQEGTGDHSGLAPQTITRKLPPPPRRPSPPPSTSNDAPRITKRGWVPTSGSTSESISQRTLTAGWIDTPAKYLAQASMSRELEVDEDEHPPAKRRKTLADCIISTAFSAALIGTAVGMTAYRIWRDRGNPPDGPTCAHMDAPPPYENDEWTKDLRLHQPQVSSQTSKPHKKPRAAARRVPRQRRTPIALSPARSPLGGVSLSRFTLSKHEAARDDGPGELEDQMDWMSHKIRNLIEEGQKALGKEIVIKTDEQIDEEDGVIDDGMDGWEEELDVQESCTASPSVARPRRNSTISLAVHASPPYPHTRGLPGSHDNATTYPRVKRSRYAAGRSHPETTPRWRSSGVGTPKLGHRPSDETFEVIYEPESFSSIFSAEGGPNSRDEESQLLNRRIDTLRKAYKIH